MRRSLSLPTNFIEYYILMILICFSLVKDLLPHSRKNMLQIFGKLMSEYISVEIFDKCYE